MTMRLRLPLAVSIPLLAFPILSGSGVAQELATEQQKQTQVYILVFKGASPFHPATPIELLNALSERHTDGDRTHHFRTEVRDGALVGRICVDGIRGKDALARLLEQNQRLVLLECIEATAEQLEKHKAMRQVSLPGAARPASPREAAVRRPAVETGGPRLAFSLPDVFGREVRAADYVGSAVLIMAGACWCGGCQQDAAPLREIANEYESRGVHVIRSVSGDNELAALEFQKHFRLPIVHLLDANREFERRYNRDGWTFLMLADPEGRVVYRLNNPREADWQALRGILNETLPQRSAATAVRMDGISYPPATLARSGERERPHRRDLFPSLACDASGRAYLAFTTRRNGNEDVVLRIFDGQTWLPDKIVAAAAEDEFDGSVITDGQGGAWLSWTSNPGGGKYDVSVAHLLDPSTPVAPTRITSSDDDAMHARMARDAEGTLWVTYYKWHKMGARSRDKEVYARYFDGTAWSDEIRVSPPDVPDYEDHCDPAIAAWGDSVAVSWSWDFHRPAGYTQIARHPTVFFRRVSSKGGLDVVRAVSAHNIDTMPTIAAGSGKNIWCAWESIVRIGQAGANRKMVAVASFGPENREAPTVGANVSGIKRNVCSPSLSVSPSGTVVLVWAESDTEREWVLKRAEFDKRQRTWGNAETLRSEGNPRFPSAAYSPDGDLWIACSVDSRAGGREIAVVQE